MESEKKNQKREPYEQEFKGIPSSIFRDRNLAPLELMSEYLMRKGLTYSEIAKLLKRDDRTIWTSIHRAKKKREQAKKADRTEEKNPFRGKQEKEKQRKETHENERQGEEGQEKQIPLHIFHNRELAPLEGISKYLKEVANLSYHEIAVLLNRNDRTIWTCYNRAKKKLLKNENLKTAG